MFVALCRRYGLQPYREPGRRYSTVLVRAPKTFQERTLWPEFLALSEELEAHLQELTDRVIREAINDDVSEAPAGEPVAALLEGQLSSTSESPTRAAEPTHLRRARGEQRAFDPEAGRGAFPVANPRRSGESPDADSRGD